MKINYIILKSIMLLSLLFMIGCGGGSSTTSMTDSTKSDESIAVDPIVLESIPLPIVDSSTPELPDMTVNINYEKSVTLPDCDISNPQVHMIESSTDWDQINNVNKTIFCVSPGDYSGLESINLTENGTSDEPRYIILNNGNNTHPVNLSRTELAKYRLKFTNADHWVIDRQAYWETTDPFERYNELFASSDNIFNRGLLQDTSNGFTLRNGSHRNTIQNHHIEKTQWSVERHNFYDIAAINLACHNNGEAIKETIVVNNEIINYVDAFQVARLYDAYTLVNGTVPQINFEGTIVSDNDMYVTNIMYSDGAGNSTSTGERSFTENAIDLKGGSLNSANPVIITNNRMWGYKPVDNTYSNLADAGNTIVVHYNVPNVEITQNVIFNSYYGISGGGPLGDGYPLVDSNIRSNIFYNIKENAISFYGTNTEGIYDGAKNVKIEGNYFARNMAKVIKLYNTMNVSIENNTFVESDPMWFGETERLGDKYKSIYLIVADNTFYNMESGIASYAYQVNNVIVDKVILYSDYDLEYITR